MNNKINKYLKDNRLGKSANLLEREALSDEFLDNALDGFAESNSDQLNRAALQQLEKQLQAKCFRKKKQTIYYWGAAACILFISGLVYIQFHHTSDQLLSVDGAKKTISSENEHNATDTLVLQPKQLDILPKKIVSAIPKKIIPKQSKIAINHSDSIVSHELIMKDHISLNTSNRGDIENAQVNKPDLLTDNVHQDKFKIQGVIKDENGVGLAGASVQVKGLSNLGAITNDNGEFELHLPQNLKESTLEVSYLGYLSASEAIDNKELFAFNLSPSQQELSEVVTIGYGVVRKKYITGSISTISASTKATLSLRLTQRKSINRKSLKEVKKELYFHMSNYHIQRGGKYDGRVKIWFNVDQNGQATDLVQNKNADQDYAHELIDQIGNIHWDVESSNYPVKMAIRMRFFYLNLEIEE